MGRGIAGTAAGAMAGTPVPYTLARVGDRHTLKFRRTEGGWDVLPGDRDTREDTHTCHNGADLPLILVMPPGDPTGQLFSKAFEGAAAAKRE